MESKQGAVDWLIKLYQQTGKIDIFDLEVANQMFKEQIMDAAKIDLGWQCTTTTKTNKAAEDYYKENYGK
jgi:phage-related protein